MAVNPLGLHADAIVAVATAPGRGAVGIVRLSGQDLSSMAQRLCGRTLVPRMATYLPFLDAQGQAIDQGLALYFPSPHSYTGQDVLELQVHGGPVVLQLLLARCFEVAQELVRELSQGLVQDGAKQGGQGGQTPLRMAQPGEFTQRAFLNQKIDLAQAEAIADLIDATTDVAARSAARSLSGAFSLEIQTLRAQLTQLRMLVEATLDFPEEDVEFLQQANALAQLQGLQTTLARVLQSAQQGAILREGIKVVIAGQPNAGKSSLLNALAGAELAIVSPEAGTTRDKVAQLIQIEGVPVHVVDTAGLRNVLLPEVGQVEKIGIARAWEEIQTAHAVLFVHDLTRHGNEGENATNYIANDASIQSALSQKLPASTQIIHVWSKADLVPFLPPLPLEPPEPSGVLGSAPPEPRNVPEGLRISTHTGQGLQDLRQQLLRLVGWQSVPEGVFMARQRHVHALHGVQNQLALALQQLQAASPALDLLAEDLRQADQHLAHITGEFSADDLLGEIFSRFCIGK